MRRLEVAKTRKAGACMECRKRKCFHAVTPPGSSADGASPLPAYTSELSSPQLEHVLESTIRNGVSAFHQTGVEPHGCLESHMERGEQFPLWADMATPVSSFEVENHWYAQSFGLHKEAIQMARLDATSAISSQAPTLHIASSLDFNQFDDNSKEADPQFGYASAPQPRGETYNAVPFNFEETPISNLSMGFAEFENRQGGFEHVTLQINELFGDHDPPLTSPELQHNFQPVQMIGTLNAPASFSTPVYQNQSFNDVELSDAWDTIIYNNQATLSDEPPAAPLPFAYHHSTFDNT
ncbi:hypothetical protein G7Y89_g11122 [Cudoniella acicularis]|uniref:Uncharacterized protein n=1 Tax=Cudoniella acicularis TaxID=354080 RepID=A0A8H4RDQ5_9HELO|nr:hypothetical protein G7Y89_g11122 [Cudoniella acicularis]